MRILVTGSEGNIGSKLVPHLQRKGHLVYRCDIIQQRADDYSVININSPADFTLVFSQFHPDVVYHLAAMVSRVTCEDSPALTIQTNLSGLYNVVLLCRKFKARLFYFSTSEVYGNIGDLLHEQQDELRPNNIYGLSKLLGEKLVQYELTRGLSAVIVRPFMFYDEDETLGTHRSAMIRFAESLVRRQQITVHRGSQRSWMHISCAVDVLERLLYTEGFNIVNIGSGEVISMSDLARMMCAYLGLEYSEYVRETDLPERMTLTKIPDLNLQRELTNFLCNITLDEGIKLVIDKVKQRI